MSKTMMDGRFQVATWVVLSNNGDGCPSVEVATRALCWTTHLAQGMMPAGKGLGMGVPMSTGMARLGISSNNYNGNIIAVEDTLTSARIALPRAVCISGG